MKPINDICMHVSAIIHIGVVLIMMTKLVIILWLIIISYWDLFLDENSLLLS